MEKVTKTATSKPIVTILAGVHGNEISGVRALKKAISSLTIHTGTVHFIICNSKAIKEKKRFVDQDLNRLFLPSSLKKKLPNSANNEKKIAKKLAPLLAKTDYLLDLHSSASPASPVFAICEPHAYPIAENLPVNIIASGFDKLEPGATDRFVNLHKGIGICLELGYHNNPNGPSIGYNAIKKFLITIGVIHTKAFKEKKRKKYITFSTLYKTKKNFLPAKSFKDFQSVKKGQTIGHDANTAIKAPADGLVLFVRKKDKPHQEAFLFAKK